MPISVQAGNVQDRDGAKEVLLYCKGTYPRLALIWTDAAYRGDLVTWTKDKCGWALEIVTRTDDQKGFVVQPRRWVVERTFAWLYEYRRLIRDYEYLPANSEAMIRLAMCHIMVRRVTKLKND